MAGMDWDKVRDQNRMRREKTPGCPHTGGLMRVSKKWMRCKFCLKYVKPGSPQMYASERPELSEAEMAEVRAKVQAVVDRIASG